MNLNGIFGWNQILKKGYKFTNRPVDDPGDVAVEDTSKTVSNFSSRIVRLSPNKTSSTVDVFRTFSPSAKAENFPFARRVSSRAAFSRAKSLFIVLSACLHPSSSAYHAYDVRAVWDEPVSSFFIASLIVCKLIIIRETVTVQFNSTLSLCASSLSSPLAESDGMQPLRAQNPELVTFICASLKNIDWSYMPW
uniref:Uncharacterized protein n=1 Tax=Glossina palpalis gambiensis TaxID=67801 RepID=A0A1B0B7E7_9MUSC